jgi:hypothetical protein
MMAPFVLTFKTSRPVGQMWGKVEMFFGVDEEVHANK